ncbi:MAG: acyl-CoA dehydrogenase [Desulfobacterales bacterium]|nr:acyl-CoA dehydrogenase [Desulfobacterales bacterium]
MNFDFTPEDQTLLDKLAVLAADLPGEDQLAADDILEARAGALGVLERLAAADYLALGVRPADADKAVVSLAATETLAAGARSAMLMAAVSTRMLGRAVAAWGDEGQQTQWLHPLVAGRRLGALALSETGLNIDNDPLKTAARREGDDFRLGGKKSFVINAPLADVIGVVGLFEKRPALFLVSGKAEGLRVGARTPTMGHDALWLADLQLADTRLDAASVIQLPADVDLLDRLRLWENEILTAQALGLMRSTYETARDYAKSHRTGGKPIIAFQEVGFKLAEMLTLYQTAQLLAYRTVWTAAVDPKAARSLNWCAKVFATEAAEEVAGHALRILGKEGGHAGSQAAAAYRAVKLTQIAGTSTEIARVKIGDAALGY